MPRTEKYFVGPRLLSDIREVITRVAGAPDKTRGPELPVRLQELQRRSAGNNIKMCGWTSTWFVAGTAVVTLYDGESFQSGGTTTTAYNSFFGVNPGSGVVLRSQGTWQLISVRLDTQAGFDGGSIQLLGHDVTTNPGQGEVSGVNDFNLLRWYSVTQCGTATAT